MDVELRRRLQCAAMVLGCFAGVVPAAELVATVEQSGPLTVGDPVTVVVAAQGGAPDWLWGELEVDLTDGGEWALLDQQPIDGALPPAWRLQFAPLEVGSLELPPMSTTVRTPQRQKVELTERTAVEVASVLAEDDGEPAPMRAPIGVQGFPWEWVLPAVVPLLAGVAAGLLWRRRRTVDGSGPVRRLSPLDELERTLAEVERSLASDEADVLCDRLAGALRRFVGRRTGEPAVEMTSLELRAAGHRNGWPQEVLQKFQQALAVADAVRFAQQRLDVSRLGAACAQARAGARALDALLRSEETSSEEAA